MGSALVVLGVVLNASLLVLLGTSTFSAPLQYGTLAGQVVGAALVILFRRRLPPAFWACVTISVTPVVALVALIYPQATLVVMPTVFLLVLFTSSMLTRVVARIVAVEALGIAAVVIVQDHAGRELLAAELFFVVLTLAVIHVLLVRGADSQADLVRRLELAARVDGLTGLRARRDFEASVAAELGRGHITSLLVVDVDHFKSINDTHGHLAGDAALRQVGTMLVTGVRADDAVVGRLGGDEFAVLLCGCPPDAALARADDLVRAVATGSFCTPDGGRITVGISVGVATLATGDFADLYALADGALYASKRAGRGRAHSPFPRR